jgi:hypothetical protein
MTRVSTFLSDATINANVFVAVKAESDEDTKPNDSPMKTEPTETADEKWDDEV